jgi:hypothetical protein
MNAKAILAICIGYGAGVWFSFLALKKRALLDRARGWMSTTGRILESTLYRHPTRNGTHFRVHYEFMVGEKIVGTTPRAAGDWFWNDKEQAAFVARFVPGQEIEVFYDARDPRQNCLDRSDASGITAMWIIALGGTLLASLLTWLQLS